MALVRLAILLVLACSSPPAPVRAPATPGAPPVDPQVAALLADVDRALAEAPADGYLLYLRAAITAQSGASADATLPYLTRLDAAGWDVPAAPTDFAAIANDPRYRAIADRIAARHVVVKRSQLAFTVPGPELIPEGIAVDPATGVFYLGSIRKRTILAIDSTGATRTFVAPRRDGLMGVLGLKVDPTRGVLWATSYAVDSIEDYRKELVHTGALYAFALADGALKRRIELVGATEPHLLNDLALAPDGTVYVTDSVAGRVWRVPPDRDVLEPLTPPATFRYPNGIVLAPSGMLYVAHVLGISILHPATGAIRRMASASGVPLGGIDGLLIDPRSGRLLAVQNGLGVPRLIAITLDADARATALAVLENDREAFDIPTTSTIWQGELYTIANSQLDALTPEGLRPGRVLADPRILRTPL